MVCAISCLLSWLWTSMKMKNVKKTFQIALIFLAAKGSSSRLCNLWCPSVRVLSPKFSHLSWSINQAEWIGQQIPIAILPYFIRLYWLIMWPNYQSLQSYTIWQNCNRYLLTNSLSLINASGQVWELWLGHTHTHHTLQSLELLPFAAKNTGWTSSFSKLLCFRVAVTRPISQKEFSEPSVYFKHHHLPLHTPSLNWLTLCFDEMWNILMCHIDKNYLFILPDLANDS